MPPRNVDWISLCEKGDYSGAFTSVSADGDGLLGAKYLRSGSTLPSWSGDGLSKTSLGSISPSYPVSSPVSASSEMTSCSTRLSPNNPGSAHDGGDRDEEYLEIAILAADVELETGNESEETS